MSQTPTAAQVVDVLFKAMQHPPRQLGNACRPRRIALVDGALLEPLQVLLKSAGLEIEFIVAVFPDEFNETIRELEKHLRGNEPEMPAMLETSGVTPELLRGVYDAAAKFYQAAPWVQLSNDQVAAVRHLNENNYRYTLVMGQGGVEYGLMMYTDWSEVKHQLMNDDDPVSR